MSEDHTTSAKELADTIQRQQQRIAQLESELADLQTRHSLLEHAADIADLGHGLWDEDLNRETYVSDVLARIHGMSHQEYLDKVTCFDTYVENIIVPEDQQAYQRYEESYDLDLSGKTSSHDFRIRLPDGGSKYLRQTSRFLTDSSDPPRRSVVAVQDVSQIKQVEEGLKESQDQAAQSQELLRITTRVAGLGHAVWNYATAQYVYVSEEWADIFGYSAQEYLANFIDLESDIELIHPSDRDRYLEYYNSEGEAVIEYRILNRNGDVRHVEQHYHYDEESSPETGVVTLQDITERKMAEMNIIQSSKLATLGEMSTSLAHELNQPLNAIRLAVENMALQVELGNIELPPTIPEKMDRIKAQVKRAAEIIDHMRMFGREANDDSYRFDARESVEGCMKIYGEQLRLSQIEVVMSVSNRPLMVEGHPIRLEQVIINLVSNAMHSMKSLPTNDDHQLLIEASENEDQQAVIRLCDTGGGIPEAVLDRIFEPFFTTKSLHEGTGLGLSVSYGIIREMKGELVAENTEQGACFTIRLPPAQGRRSRQSTA